MMKCIIDIPRNFSMKNQHWVVDCLVPPGNPDFCRYMALPDHNELDTIIQNGLFREYHYRIAASA